MTTFATPFFVTPANLGPPPFTTRMKTFFSIFFVTYLPGTFLMFVTFYSPEFSVLIFFFLFVFLSDFLPLLTNKTSLLFN